MTVDEVKRVKAIFEEALGIQHTLRPIVPWHFSTFFDRLFTSPSGTTPMSNTGDFKAYNLRLSTAKKIVSRSF